jgi:hypothetical protein
MDWVTKLVKVRGKQIPDYRVDTISEWVTTFRAKEGRLPSKEEVLEHVAYLCKVNLWNINTINRLKEFVFGEKVEKPPQNPTEALAKELGIGVETKDVDKAKTEVENKVEGGLTNVVE